MHALVRVSLKHFPSGVLAARRFSVGAMVNVGYRVSGKRCRSSLSTLLPRCFARLKVGVLQPKQPYRTSPRAACSRWKMEKMLE